MLNKKLAAVAESCTGQLPVFSCASLFFFPLSFISILHLHIWGATIIYACVQNMPRLSFSCSHLPFVCLSGPVPQRPKHAPSPFYTIPVRARALTPLPPSLPIKITLSSLACFSPSLSFLFTVSLVSPLSLACSSSAWPVFLQLYPPFSSSFSCLFPLSLWYASAFFSSPFPLAFLPSSLSSPSPLSCTFSLSLLFIVLFLRAHHTRFSLCLCTYVRWGRAKRIGGRGLTMF